MKTILLETHAHTSEVSGCGKIPARELVERYAKAGYDALMTTDHLNRDWKRGLPMEQRVAAFLRGYEGALEAGRALGVSVLLGAELRLLPREEDYLAIGLCEEDLPWVLGLLDAEPTLAQLHDELNAHGVLLVQAHPFRKRLLPQEAACLDGIEVYNGNPRHDSHNWLARGYARRSHLLMTSGSDAHQPEDVGRGGMRVPEGVNSSRALAEYLRTGRPEFIETA